MEFAGALANLGIFWNKEHLHASPVAARKPSQDNRPASYLVFASSPILFIKVTVIHLNLLICHSSAHISLCFQGQGLHDLLEQPVLNIR